MSTQPEIVLTCDACGATVYPEMLAAGSAERRAGRLLCAHCVREARGGMPDAEAAAPAPGAPIPGAPSTMVRHNPGLQAERPAGAVAHRRALDPSSPYATRCRTFHCRLSDGAIGHLNEQINEWVDSHDDVVIKFATSSVGVVEGKHADPHLVVTVFY